MSVSETAIAVLAWLFTAYAWLPVVFRRRAHAAWVSRLVLGQLALYCLLMTALGALPWGVFDSLRDSAKDVPGGMIDFLGATALWAVLTGLGFGARVFLSLWCWFGRTKEMPQ